MRNVKRNIFLNLTAAVISGIAYAAASGTLMQVFLNSLGFSASQIYLLTTVTQAVQIAVNLTCTRIGNRGSFFRTFALIVGLEGLLYGCYVPLCLHMSADWSAYLILLLIGILNALATALSALLNFKLPYLIYRPEDYGKVSAATGILSSVIQMVIGLLMTWLASRFTYQVIMPWVFPIAGLLILLSGLINFLYRPLEDPQVLLSSKPEEKKNRGTVWQVLRRPFFYHLAYSGAFPPVW